MNETKTGQASIRLDGVVVRRSGRTVLEDLDMTLPRGKVTAIMGPSGSGKTTVLKLITGQLRPDAGTVTVEDRDVTSLGAKQLTRLRRDIGVLLQNGALLTDLTCFDNVALPLREHTRLPEPLIRRLVLLKLQAVGLRGVADYYPRALSGGMARRVALARALALDPAIMLYDEPFAGLDPISMGASIRLIRQLNRTLGITSVICTHDVWEVNHFADYCYIIADGRAVASGTPEELNETHDETVRQFLRGLPDGPVPFHYPASDLADDLLGYVNDR